MDCDPVVPGKTAILNINLFIITPIIFQHAKKFIKCSQDNESVLKLKGFVENGKFIDAG